MIFFLLLFEFEEEVILIIKFRFVMYLVYYERKLWIIEKINEFKKKKKLWNCLILKIIFNDNRNEI